MVTALPVENNLQSEVQTNPMQPIIWQIRACGHINTQTYAQTVLSGGEDAGWKIRKKADREGDGGGEEVLGEEEEELIHPSLFPPTEWQRAEPPAAMLTL